MHSLVTRLRRAAGPSLIRTVRECYLLDVDPEDVDLLRFRRLTDRAARTADPAAARATTWPIWL